MASPSSSGSGEPDSRSGNGSPQPRARAEYSLSNIMASRQTASAADLASSAKNVTSSPCFRQSMLWAGAVGLMFAGHRWKQGGSWRRVANDAALAWMGTFGTQWFLCRRDEHDRRLALRAYYAEQQRLQSGQDLRPLEPSGAASEPAEGSGADTRAEWQQELAKLTQYELPTVIPGSTTSVPLDR